MKHYQNQTSLIWVFDRAQFHFDDTKSYEKWKKHQKIEFELNLANSDDYGEAIHEGNDFPTSCHYEITPEIADINIEHNDAGPVISGEVDVLMAFKPDITQQALTEWHDGQGGWATATISIDDNATYATDHGSWFRLVHFPGHPNPISVSDSIPF